MTIGNILISDGSIKKTYVENTMKVVEYMGTHSLIVDNRYGVFHAKNNGDVNKTSLGMLVSKKTYSDKR